MLWMPLKREMCLPGEGPGAVVATSGARQEYSVGTLSMILEGGVLTGRGRRAAGLPRLLAIVAVTVVVVVLNLVVGVVTFVVVAVSPAFTSGGRSSGRRICGFRYRALHLCHRVGNSVIRRGHWSAIFSDGKSFLETASGNFRS